MLKASGVGARLELERIPLSTALIAALPGEHARLLALTCGDDYELCVCVAPERRSEVEARLGDLGCPVTTIGTITAEPGLAVLRADGSAVPETSGYRHFP